MAYAILAHKHNFYFILYSSLRNLANATLAYKPYFNFILWALPNKKAPGVARFIYEEIYWRYLAPGECIITDNAGELCGKVMKDLAATFGVKIQCSAAGRPQGNGIAEAQVKNMKNKMQALILEKRNFFFQDT